MWLSVGPVLLEALSLKVSVLHALSICGLALAFTGLAGLGL